MSGGGFNPAPAIAPLIDQPWCLPVYCGGAESVGALRDRPRQIAFDGERAVGVLFADENPVATVSGGLGNS